MFVIVKYVGNSYFSFT